MKNKSLILSTGLAMFSMFFGSGNLVFPLVVGQMSNGHFTLAAFGILLTGVLVPFLGILAMLLFNGSSRDFFGRLGKPAIFWFPLIALSLMGPFGVLARCITVAHGAFKLIAPDVSLWLFSMISCAVIFLLTIRKNRIVPLLGSILTPILLLSLGAIAFFGLKNGEFPQMLDGSAWDSFKTGIFQGYQTMDLLAAFFFSAFVIKHLKDHHAEESSTLSVFFKSSLVGAGLLSLIYVVLVILGALYAPQLASVQPQEMLAFVAQASLGSFAAPVVCCAVVLACITTAIVLTSLFADFLKKEVTKDKINTSIALITTLTIAFFISILEFSGIARILGPILEAIYPALIVLTVLSIFHKLWGWRTVRVPFAIAFLAKILLRI
ncbi:MAG: branched-chain amino acid transport system II carrier protein [Parachlamydiales bacterium]|nr:branched-chain amino acid transport system II carrier protein [Parachlamydiales bacterium]